MAQSSFDIESDYDTSELNNVVDQTRREIANRYDFKNTNAALDWKSPEKLALIITGDTQFQIDAILDILRKKIALRGQSQKCIDVSREPITSNLRVKLEVPLVRGLDQSKAKIVITAIRSEYPKIKTQIQGEAIRVTSPKKDELQLVINLLKSTDFEFPIIFTNYR